MVVVTENVVYSEVTGNSGYAYVFTSKHHDGKDPDAARWLPELTEPEEFSVFDLADENAVADADGHLYGILRPGLRTLGSVGQQIAKFWLEENSDQPWHGYPLWPVNANAPRRLRKEKTPRAIILQLEQKQLIRVEDRRRLIKGKHA